MLHHANTRKDNPTTTRSTSSGINPSSTRPAATDARCTTSVAAVTPASTVHHRYRVANHNATSWDLSPHSATKIRTVDHKNPDSIPATPRTAGTIGRATQAASPGPTHQT